MILILNWIVESRFKRWVFAAWSVVGSKVLRLGSQIVEICITSLDIAVSLRLDLRLEVVSSSILELTGEYLIRKAWAVLTRRLESFRRPLVPTINTPSLPATCTRILYLWVEELWDLISRVELTCTAENAFRFCELLNLVNHIQPKFVAAEELFRWLKLAS